MYSSLTQENQIAARREFLPLPASKTSPVPLGQGPAINVCRLHIGLLPHVLFFSLSTDKFIKLVNNTVAYFLTVTVQRDYIMLCYLRWFSLYHQISAEFWYRFTKLSMGHAQVIFKWHFSGNLFSRLLLLESRSGFVRAGGRSSQQHNPGLWNMFPKEAGKNLTLAVFQIMR